MVLCNYTPEPRVGYRVGVPLSGTWQVLLNTDSECFGGSGVGETQVLQTEAVKHHDRAQSVVLDLPPLGVVFLNCRERAE